MTGVSTARAWLAMQTNYDLAQALKNTQPVVRPLCHIPFQPPLQS
nr:MULTISPECIES: hypothetical protein [unclassified Bartonella]